MSDHPIITLKLPDNLAIVNLSTEDLPPKWWINPAPSELARIGKQWIEEQ